MKILHDKFILVNQQTFRYVLFGKTKKNAFVLGEKKILRNIHCIRIRMRGGIYGQIYPLHLKEFPRERCQLQNKQVLKTTF